MTTVHRPTEELAREQAAEFLQAILDEDYAYAAFILDWLGLEEAVIMLETLIRRPRLVVTR